MTIARDRTRNGLWWLYNDQVTKEATPEQVATTCDFDGSPMKSYIVLYERSASSLETSRSKIVSTSGSSTDINMATAHVKSISASASSSDIHVPNSDVPTASTHDEDL